MKNNTSGAERPLPATSKTLATQESPVVHGGDLRGLPGRAKLGNKALMMEIQRVFDRNFRAHGARRIWRKLNEEGIAVDRYTVAKLMRAMGLQGGARRQVREPDPVGDVVDPSTDRNLPVIVSAPEAATRPPNSSNIYHFSRFSLPPKFSRYG